MLERTTALVSVPESILGIDPGIIWALTLVIALAYAMRLARRFELDWRVMYWAGVCAILGGIWGAHIFDLLANGSNGDHLMWLRFWSGPKSYYGGLIGGALTGATYLRLRKLSLLSYADAAVPAVALGYGIGRIGCFLNGDDFGTLSNLPWAVQYSPGTEAQASHLAHGLLTSANALSLPVHPVQLYSSLLGLGLCVFLSRWKFPGTGARFCMFAVSYGVARFGLEWLRGDALATIGPLSLPQVCSLIFAFSGICIWLSLHCVSGSRMRAYSIVSSKPQA
jgi:phosphatidylglycerol:prolipoprotein diacylglycerol transferase